MASSIRYSKTVRIPDGIQETRRPNRRPRQSRSLFRDLPRRKHASLFDHQGQVLRTYVAEATTAPAVALQLT